MSYLKIIDSKVLTLMEDLGRFGYEHLGVSNSGVLDEYSARFANKLLDNNPKAPLLENFFGNLEFEVMGDTNIAITGAKCEFSINNIPQELWSSHSVRSGDFVKIGKVIEGTRVYIAIKNGFNIKKDLGSASVSVKEGFGGEKLKTNDTLFFTPSAPQIHKRVPKDLIPDYSKPLVLRVIPSYQNSYFPKEEQEKFFSNEYTITNDFNRMACKLKGESINCDIDGIISEGIAFGAIQIPKNGQPIILLKERQTIGGYPKIGAILPIDCFRLAQEKFNGKVNFEVINVGVAQKKLKSFFNLFKKD